jgi:membrane-associated phospholipid phosphatase
MIAGLALRNSGRFGRCRSCHFNRDFNRAIFGSSGCQPFRRHGITELQRTFSWLFRRFPGAMRAPDGTTKGSCCLSDKRSSILKTFLVAVTDFGDAALLIPLGAVMLFWLFQHDWRSTIWWAISVGFCVGFTAVLKIFYYGCPPAPDMRSPSGHTGFSILIYGAIALVTAVPARGLSRTLAIVLGAGIVLAIAISRLILAIHTFPEVSLGVVIGLVSLMLFARVYFNSPNDQVWPLLVSSGILIAMLHGQELHAEELLHHITSYIGIQCG